MSIFDEDDSDAGSEASAYSDSSVESDEELPQGESNSSNWLRVPNTLSSYKGKNVVRSNDSEDQEEIELRSP
ncbi:hypothetical protein BGZ96_004715, partial [Linnemannia gamsii]